jgi:addiction module HigA family antidote
MPHSTKRLAPVHPGAILREELEERGLSVNAVARALRVPVSRVDELVKGKRAVSADTALRLARYFGSSAQFWMNLQTAYDLDSAQDRLAAAIDREVLPCA